MESDDHSKHQTVFTIGSSGLSSSSSSSSTSTSSSRRRGRGGAGGEYDFWKVYYIYNYSKLTFILGRNSLK